MRVLGSVCMVLLVSAGVAHAQNVKSKVTPAELQGTWKVIQRVYSQDNADTAAVGKTFTALGYKLSLDGAAITPKDDNNGASALTFTVDESQFPHTIDITVPGTNGQCDKTLYGIYKVECGVLSIAVGNGATRPTSFQNQFIQVLLILKHPPVVVDN
jgi:uncharacterized protein (TIGR03067 family)